MKYTRPSYIRAFKEGTLRESRIFMQSALHDCTLCPRKCKVDRYTALKGECRTGLQAVVSSAAPHFGEEAPLVGQQGSGTIFFTHCNLHCNFCQNFDISHEGIGETVSDEQLAHLMLYLQQRGCHNINLVTPSHVVPQIISALELAVEAGLCIPLVYNTSGYDEVKTLEKLEGIVDIYMPDLKFLDRHIASRTCRAGDYPAIARKAILEMYRQVGHLQRDDRGIAFRGLLVRHLVMPGYTEDSKEVLSFIAEEVSPETYVNIMPQYRPAGELSNTTELDRPLEYDEYTRAVEYAKEIGLTNLL
jgi:putative pyruvate formate lyase activating enzyme